jgi:PST family polysaccharide transporter
MAMKEMSVEEVQRRARTGPLYLLGRRGVAAAIGFISTVTIARLLSPRDYGLAAMSIVILAFVQVFRDFGLTNASLRKGHIDQAEVSFLFWFNAAATTVMALLIAAASPLIADFYREPAVRDIVLVSLIGFVIGGWSLQHNALMRRDLRFGMVAAVETVSLLVGFLVGLTVAIIRHDYWAIVASGLAQSFTSSAINLWATKWRPDRPRVVPEARDLLKFGANATLYSTLNFASRYISVIIIGRDLGTVSLGHFNRAYNLYMLPQTNVLRPIQQATLPVMARLRPHPEHYRTAYLGLVERLCTAMVPASVVLCFAGVPLVHLLLGDKWTSAGQVLSALAPGLAVYGVISPISDLLVSQNRSGELRTTGIYDFIARLTGTLVGAQFGLVGAALGFTLGTVAILPNRVRIAGRSGPITMADQWRALLPSLPLGLGTAVGCAAGYFGAAYTVQGDLVPLVLIGTGGALGALLAAAVVPASRRALKSLVLTMAGRYQVGAKSAKATAEPAGETPAE